MAPTEVRVARPERRWGCRRGTPNRRMDTAWRHRSCYAQHLAVHILCTYYS